MKREETAVKYLQESPALDDPDQDRDDDNDQENMNEFSNRVPLTNPSSHKIGRITNEG